MSKFDEILIFDTETTGLPPKGAKWQEDYKEFSYLVEIAWTFRGRYESYIIRPEGWTIPEESTQIHGISQGRAEKRAFSRYARIA